MLERSRVSDLKGQSSSNVGPVCLVACDAKQRRAQGALLRSFGYDVVFFEVLDDLLSDESVDTSCLVIDLRGLGSSPGDCLLELRKRRLKMPVIMLADMVGQDGFNRVKGVRDPVGGQAYLLWQPVDVELYLATLAAVTHP
jgi:DNA-binding NtrC family response regulator